MNQATIPTGTNETSPLPEFPTNATLQEGAGDFVGREEESFSPKDSSEDATAGTTPKKKRAAKKDRSNSKYSEKDYMAMPRNEQLLLAREFLGRPCSDFDDGTFCFSRTHLSDLIKDLGFETGVYDPQIEEARTGLIDSGGSHIYIEHGRRKESVIKKLTLSMDTVNMMEELLDKRLSNIEKSKVIDEILHRALETLLRDKKANRFSVSYRPIAEERLI